MPEFLKSKYFWSILLAVVATVAFIVTHYNRYCNFDLATSLIGVAASIFALVLNGILLIRLTDLQADKMGELKEEKPTIILALMLFVIYTSISVVTSYYNIYKLPVQAVCK
jgi:hypothetical protein